MRQKDRRLSFFATSIKRRIPNVAKFPKKSATEKPSSRTRPELGAKFRNRAGFCIFFRPPTERGRVLFSAQIRNTAMAEKFDRYVEEFLLFCFSVDFQTHNKLICIKN